MANIRFMYENLVDIATIGYSTQSSPDFLASNLKHIWHTRSWRSRYGTGSGWGRFEIVANVNDRLDFEETNGVPLAAILTPGTYYANTIYPHLKTQMEAVGASTYTWSYNSIPNKFRVESNGAGGGGVLNLRWNTGPNTARSIGSSIGFNVTADDTGSLGYTADYIRIHTSEGIVFDLATAYAVNVIILKFNNWQSGATVKFQGHTANSWGTPDVSYTFPAINNSIMIYFFSVEYSKRYWRIYIEDIDNPEGYIELGRPFFGTYFEPGWNFAHPIIKQYIDPSIKRYSTGGQISICQREKYIRIPYNFPWIKTVDVPYFKAMWEVLGQSVPYFICDNPDTDPHLNTYYVINSAPWDFETLYTKGKLLVDTETMR